MKSSELTQEIDAAIVGMQADLDPAPKDSLNPHFKSRYSDLAACKSAAKPALAKHSLGVIQSIQTNLTDGTAGVVTRLIHKSGQWYQSEAWCKPKSLSPQDVGSVATYFRRYEFCAMVGLSSEEDDDGNAATGKPQGQQAKRMENAVRQPPIFDMTDEAQKAEFKRQMGEMKVIETIWRDIAMKLHGKPWSALEEVVMVVEGVFLTERG